MLSPCRATVWYDSSKQVRFKVYISVLEVYFVAWLQENTHGAVIVGMAAWGGERLGGQAADLAPARS